MKKSLCAFSLVAIIMLGCDGDEISKSSGKLDYYTESYDLAGLGLDFTPQYKVTYQYDHDKLIRYTFFGYSPDSKSFVKQRYFDFSYVDDRVDKIKGYQAGATTHYIEYTYQYLPDSRVLKISENNSGTGINSEANFSYNDTDEKVMVAYSFSNGGSFEYEFNYGTSNILSDKTTRGAQLCSDGVYTYDENKNPFSELGYVDYTLSNLSANNKLTEDVNYVGCAFPSLVPESYSYEYNNVGYPTKATTFYSSGATSVKQFFYR
ncbi:MAG TPA: hypothetical protein VFU05_12360 [Cyclobacteriaceae bacterium]|nr:hypothetical protein [Cyclobacteriaceae bacterium]